ncbi:MAG: hypothetical protein COA69_11445 [Robiginitomaculum sp.]|nr:MAG: hypothetical protein COA69_11445 [Robiginitomaculum sp.]
MTTYPLYQVDAFTQTLFEGNPAAIVPLDVFLPDDILQSIAIENNLAETAFVVARTDGSYDLRWFTPSAEIDFCGHATIATAHVLFEEHAQNTPPQDPLVFHTQIGTLNVTRAQIGKAEKTTGKSGYVLHAPNYPCRPLAIDEYMIAAFGEDIRSASIANNIYLEFANAETVQNYTPLMVAITHMLEKHSASMPKPLGVSIMAPGNGKWANYDFVSRHFCPLHGIPEDPVTGSAHSALAPFWAARLGKNQLTAFQCSPRGGLLHLHVYPDAVHIIGQAVSYLRGEITLP